MVRQSLAEAISVAALVSMGLAATVFGPFWPNAWRHSIGVQHGQVLEQNKHTFSARWLWIEDDNCPDMTKGYMREILKVYCITKRSQGKQGRRANDGQGSTGRRAKRARA